MLTIETTQVDSYVQTICKDRDLDPAERAASAATAISIHVMQEFGLTLGTEVQVPDDLVDFAAHDLNTRGKAAYDALYDLVEEGYDALDLDDKVVEDDSVRTESSEVLEGQAAEGFPVEGETR